jgi:hypothetical protein
LGWAWAFGLGSPIEKVSLTFLSLTSMDPVILFFTLFRFFWNPMLLSSYFLLIIFFFFYSSFGVDPCWV